jgi:ribosomal protein L11 methyltransferase
LSQPEPATPNSATLVRLTVDLPDSAAARTVSERLAELDDCPPLATSQFEDPATRRWRVDAYYDAAPPPDAILGALVGIEVVCGPAIEAVPDANWVALSQAALPPVTAGRFLIHGGHDRAKVGRRQWSMEIEAGEAFGTAHHSTTEGCLLALDRIARTSKARRILDLGCGSGVLAIAASRLWPDARVMASDIDPVATDVARANARLNRAGRRLAVVTASGLASGELRRAAPFDLVVANILAGPLIRLAPALAAATRPHGILVLSGILSEQAREVSGVYTQAGFRCLMRETLAGWTTLTLTRCPRLRSSKPPR